ncbi:hypothetical protein [Komagataeibacter oboediens]|uniref:hypothetical protein n=1 Tax=Komagataeibacter oboediens TaxID=65958 RepID=UPI0012F4A897|nr:hypothetical protein [Komagataeibacter oboediens]
MVTYESKNLTFVEISLGFKDSDLLRRKQFDFEDAFKPIIKGSSIQLPALPNQPVVFWVMADNKRRLQATKEGLTLIMNVKNMSQNIKICDLISKYTEHLNKSVKDILSPTRPISVKLAAVSQWPSREPVANVEKDIARRVIRASDEAGISNANITLNKRVKVDADEALVSFNIFAYKSIEVKINININDTNSSAPMNQQHPQIGETGLLSRIEVSKNIKKSEDKLAENSDINKSFNDILPIFLQCWENDLPLILDEPDLVIGGL